MTETKTETPMYLVPIQSCEDVETAACIRNLEDGSDLDGTTFNSRLLPEGEWTDVVRRADMEAQAEVSEALIRGLKAEICERDGEIAQLKKTSLPDEMTPDIERALGTICFRAAPYAHAFRKAGVAIPAKAEAEQAFVIFKLLKGVLQHGTFEKAADILLEEAHAAIKKAKEDEA